MRISLNWLRDYIAWKGSVAELEDLLTRAGIKVESITTIGADFPNVIVAEMDRDTPGESSAARKTTSPATKFRWPFLELCCRAA